MNALTPAYQPHLKTQAQKLLAFLTPNFGKELTLDEIANETGIRTGSVASRLRDLRLEGYDVSRHHIGSGVHTYTVTPLSASQTLRPAVAA